MKPKIATQTYVAFLRGINVGGHHKVPMADLKSELESLGFEKIITILNSGNILFDTKTNSIANIEERISTHLENYFGFPIPTIVRKAVAINQLFKLDIFKAFVPTKDIRFYVSFLKHDKAFNQQLPWTSLDKSFIILAKKDKAIFSILDLSVSKTSKAMEVLEQYYGKEITTRNWNTILRIIKKFSSSINT